MAPLNALLRSLVDALLLPFRTLPPLVGLAAVSLVTAMAVLLVFRATSDQRGLEAARRAIQAGLLEVRLFNDDFGAVMRAQRDILRHNLTYLRLSLVPMAWLIVPFVLVTAQLQFHYGYTGLVPGEPVLVKVQLPPEAATAVPATGPSITLELPEGLRVETPAVWMPALREVAWRITADRAGAYGLAVRVGDTRVVKQVVVSDEVVRRSPWRVAPGILDELLSPAEPPLDADLPVRAIEVTYPPRSIGAFGFELSWLTWFVVLSLVFAFALRRRFGVTF